jgi:hypothetical protein
MLLKKYIEKRTELAAKRKSGTMYSQRVLRTMCRNSQYTTPQKYKYDLKTIQTVTTTFLSDSLLIRVCTAQSNIVSSTNFSTFQLNIHSHPETCFPVKEFRKTFSAFISRPEQ